MGAQQRLLCEALARLGEARRAMAALAAVSPDRSARARLGAEFDGVAEACREFAQCQLGMRLPGAGPGPDA